MSLSVIIPTYKNVNFLPELFNSIIRNDYNDEFEVLVGIDNCNETLNYVYENEFPSNFKFYFFIENNGPYLIKNTLAELSTYNKLFFFDSDDIMMSKMISEITSKLNEYVVVKPKYIDFVDEKNNRVFKKEAFGEGVFGITKDLFMGMNGFEGWRVAADSDFMGRLYKTNLKILHTNQILFHRRIHENSLTVHPETGLASKMRGQYFLKSRKKTIENFSNEELLKSNYKIVDIQNHSLSKSAYEITEDNELSEFELKKQKHDLIASIFSSVPSSTKITPKQKTIDYNAINKKTNHPMSSQLSIALKKAKLENIKKNSRR